MQFDFNSFLKINIYATNKVQDCNIFATKKMEKNRDQVHRNNRFRFAAVAIVLEALIIILYAVFVRVKPHTEQTLNSTYYPMFQDVNVMMLIGFGYLMTFVKRHSWSALSYTFFINAIIVQLYPLLQALWSRAFHNNWEESKIFVDEKSFTGAAYAVASMLIAFGGVLGKVGPFQLLIMSLFGLVGYTINQDIAYGLLKSLDVGGSMAIHTYGAYFGLMVSFILSKKCFPTKKVETTHMNSTFAMIGTLFLWMFWPSFNAGVFPENGFQRSLIISNTVISLTGSCLTTFILSALMREKFSMDDILNATLAGGVAIGAPAGITANAGIALLVGVIAGAVSTFGFNKISEFLYRKIGLHDTCGINNLHGMPGLLGGWISAMIIASYQTSPGFDSAYVSLVSVTANGRTYSQQAGIQIACGFIALGIALTMGLFAGLFLFSFYDWEDKQFFEDKDYFELPVEQIQDSQELTVVKKSKSSPRKLPSLPSIHPARPNQIVNVTPEQPSEINLDSSIN